MEFASLWTEASRDVDAEAQARALANARVAAAGVWPFLAQARSWADLDNRMALAEDNLSRAASLHGVSSEVLAGSFRQDFERYASQRAAAVRTRAVRKRAFLVVAESSDSSDSSDDSGAQYYVVDKDSGKDVGGPYDSESDAQDAISGGDFDEDAGDLSVADGPDGDQGDGGDDGDDSAGGSGGSGDDGSDGDGDTDDSGSGAGSGDSDSDDEPAFLKGSSRTAEKRTDGQAMFPSNGHPHGQYAANYAFRAGYNHAMSGDAPNQGDWHPQGYAAGYQRGQDMKAHGSRTAAYGEGLPWKVHPHQPACPGGDCRLVGGHDGPHDPGVIKTDPYTGRTFGDVPEHAYAATPLGVRPHYMSSKTAADGTTCGKRVPTHNTNGGSMSAACTLPPGHEGKHNPGPGQRPYEHKLQSMLQMFALPDGVDPLEWVGVAEMGAGAPGQPEEPDSHDGVPVGTDEADDHDHVARRRTAAPSHPFNEAAPWRSPVGRGHEPTYQQGRDHHDQMAAGGHDVVWGGDHIMGDPIGYCRNCGQGTRPGGGPAWSGGESMSEQCPNHWGGLEDHDRSLAKHFFMHKADDAQSDAIRERQRDHYTKTGPNIYGDPIQQTDFDKMRTHQEHPYLVPSMDGLHGTSSRRPGSRLDFPQGGRTAGVMDVRPVSWARHQAGSCAGCGSTEKELRPYLGSSELLEPGAPYCADCHKRQFSYRPEQWEKTAKQQGLWSDGNVFAPPPNPGRGERWPTGPGGNPICPMGDREMVWDMGSEEHRCPTHGRARPGYVGSRTAAESQIPNNYGGGQQAGQGAAGGVGPAPSSIPNNYGGGQQQQNQQGDMDSSSGDQAGFGDTNPMGPGTTDVGGVPQTTKPRQMPGGGGGPQPPQSSTFQAPGGMPAFPAMPPLPAGVQAGRRWAQQQQQAQPGAGAPAAAPTAAPAKAPAPQPPPAASPHGGGGHGGGGAGGHGGGHGGHGGGGTFKAPGGDDKMPLPAGVQSVGGLMAAIKRDNPKIPLAQARLLATEAMKRYRRG